tara:strand:- start:16843 stop:17238 length:396 start_codon:yes stop_codon:yes gene_type:complete
MDKKKRLKHIADSLLKKQDQADALRDLGRRNPDAASAIDNIMAAFGPVENVIEVQEHINKFESVVSLIRENIKNSKGYNNFSQSEYKEDKMIVFEIKHKILSINQVDVEDLKKVNNIYKKHINIQSILNGS